MASHHGRPDARAADLPRRRAIGRIRRWQTADDGDVVREHFTAERFVDALDVPIQGEYATFEEALERLIFYSIAH